jgi:hypothetical protein
MKEKVKKLSLSKQTVKNIKVKTTVKAGDGRTGGGCTGCDMGGTC